MRYSDDGRLEIDAVQCFCSERRLQVIWLSQAKGSFHPRADVFYA
jgi:hypothetical protein